MRRWVILLTLALFGCGGGSSGGGATDVTDAFTPGLDVQDDSGPPVDTGGGAKDDAAQPVDEDAGEAPLAVVFPIEAPVQVPAEGSKKIPVMVLDPAPVSDAPILFRLEPLDGGDGSIGTDNEYRAITGSEGTAEVRFLANAAAPAEYDLVAVVIGRGVQARLRIEVIEHPTGTLRVELDYGGVQPLLAPRIGIEESTSFSCAQFWAPSPPGDSVVGSLSTATTFADLAAEQRYTIWVTAEARGQAGETRLGASGCYDGAYVHTGSTDTYTVSLEDVVLEAAGVYDMTSVFDFRDAIPEGQVGDIVTGIADFFENPAAFALDTAEEVVSIYLGQVVGQIVQWAIDALRDQIEGAVNDWLENNAPPWLQDLFTIGEDVTQIISHMELIAVLRISKIEGAWYVQGTEEWTGVALYWRLGCPEEGEPDYDPECGRIELNLDDLVATDFPLDLVQGVWEGTVTNVDTLTIHEHPIELNYGQLILYVINEIVLPEVSNGEYHSLMDAALGLVDCDAVAENVVGDVLEALGIDRDDVAGYCETAIGAFVLPLETTLYELGADSNLRLRGVAILVDDDADLTVDRIVDGEWDGEIVGEPGSGWTGGEFTGTWEATRQ